MRISAGRIGLHIVATLGLLLAAAVAAWAQRDVRPMPPMPAAGSQLAAPQLSETPLAVLATTSDVVLAGEVRETRDARQMNLQQRGRRQVTAGRYRTYRVLVREVFKADAKTDAALRSGAIVDVYAVAPPQAAGEAPSAEMAEMLQRVLPSLQVDKSYVLFLAPLAEANSYLLLPEQSRPATAEVLQQTRQAVAIESWPWGPVVDGLHLAVLPQGDGQLLHRGRTTLEVLLAVRNVSAETLRLNLFPPDQPLLLTAQAGNQPAVTADFAGEPPAGRGLRFSAQYVVTVAPGTVQFIAPRLSQRFGLTLTMPLHEGIWRLTATYASQRQTPEDMEKLWTGEVTSAPAVVNVVPARAD